MKLLWMMAVSTLMLFIAVLWMHQRSADDLQSITPARPLHVQGNISQRGELPRLAAPWTPTPAATATPRPSPTLRPVPTITPTALPAPLPGDGPVMAGERVFQTRRFDLFIGIHSLSFAQIEPLLPRIEQALDQAELQLGSGLTDRVSVALYQVARRPGRGVRALAFSAERRIELYYAPYEDPHGVVRVIVHEVAHQYEADRYGPQVQKQADVILHEGLATWLAGAEWLQPYGTTSWQERAWQLKQAGRLRSLLDDPSGAAANDAYEGWAAFVDYLLTTYGWEAFDTLYRSSRGRVPGSANYQAVYGLSLDKLAAAWRASLGAQ